MVCRNCGSENENGAVACSSCQKPMSQQFVQQAISEDANVGVSGVKCPSCGNESIFLQTQPGVLKKGCLQHVFELMLLFIPIIGWIILAVVMYTDGKAHMGATCQKCGYHWFLSSEEADKLKNGGIV